jgi:hypothetical protein
LFGCEGSIFTVGQQSGRVPHVQIQQILVIDFSFTEQNRPTMQFLLAIFSCFPASLIGLFVLLRFEPNFRFPLFGS